jgi:hypothetical protein
MTSPNGNVFNTNASSTTGRRQLVVRPLPFFPNSSPPALSGRMELLPAGSTVFLFNQQRPVQPRSNTGRFIYELDTPVPVGRIGTLQRSSSFADPGTPYDTETDEESYTTPTRQLVVSAAMAAPERPVEPEEPTTPVRQATMHATMAAPERPLESEEPVTPTRQPTVMTNTHAPKKRKTTM